MRINEQIRIPQVRLFDDTTDEALGIVAIDRARQLAVERGLDLVEVAPTAQPPVARLMDYGRYKFEALKREKDSRRDHNVIQLKEQKLRPKISDHDFNTKLAKVKQFLGEGDKVKLTIMFRGREMVHQEFGRRLLDRMTTELRDLATIERSPLVEGRNMIMILSPTTRKPARPEASEPAGRGAGSNGRAAEDAATLEAAGGTAEPAAPPSSQAPGAAPRSPAPAPAQAEAPAAAETPREAATPAARRAPRARATPTPAAPAPPKTTTS
ncbi:MAG: translation initiation factor IF-3 [Candidatus Dormibacteria bacterium]